MVVEAFIDERRAPRWSGKDGLVRDLARELGEDLLYDDGASPVPCRWVLVRPDGERFEVFERADASGPDLVLDLEAPPRRLDLRPSGQSMSGGRAVGVQGGGQVMARIAPADRCTCPPGAGAAPGGGLWAAIKRAFGGT